MACNIVRNSKGQPVGVVTSVKETVIKKAEKEVIDRLTLTGLASNVIQLNTAGIDEKLKELGVNSSTRKQVEVWHGSPHSFERFTTDAMGTGEGVQAFGWGLYFTDLESIAETYANNLSKRQVLFNGKKEIPNELVGNPLLNYLENSIYLGDSKEEVLNNLINNKKNRLVRYNATESDYNNIVKYLESNTIESSNEKNLYKVSLHKGKQPSEYYYIEWDKAKGDYSNIFKNFINKLKEEYPNSKEILDSKFNEYREGVKELTGQVFYNNLLQSTYRLVKSNAIDKDVSLKLLEIGVDGIKYPAESIARGANSDTARGFNYVVFDENAITIEEQIKFNKVLSEKGIKLTTNGFVHNGEVYLNTDTATNETAIHEFSHLYNTWLKGNKPDLYQRGIDLISQELNNEDSEIKDIIEYVKQTQPDLVDESLQEEILTELVGRKGAELLEKSKPSTIVDWLKDVWNSIANMLGLSRMNPNQVANLTLKGYALSMGVDLLTGKKLSKLFEGQDGQANLERWVGDNELVVGSEIQDIKTGTPIVAKVYHGTTHEFYEFRGGEVGDINGHLGRINYFTSEYDDASSNYQASGADLTNRIENLKDTLLSELEYKVDENLEEEEREDRIREVVSDLYPDFDTSSLDYNMELFEVADRVANSLLVGGEELVLELYVKLNNPLVLGNGATWFNAIEIDEVYLEDATQEIADEYDITIEEAQEDYEWDIKQRALEMQGEDSNVVVTALEKALRNNGYDPTLASGIMGEDFYEEEIDLNEIEERLRRASLFENEDGELASSQVISDMFEELGFDGIILADVSDRFKNMGLHSGVSHIHVFDQYNNQIKLADGSNVTFNENDSDIRFQRQEVFSPLFEKIVSNPLLNEEDALAIYKNIYSEKFKKEVGDWELDNNIPTQLKYETGEPKLFYFSNGLVTQSYKEALDNTPEGTIQLGVLNTTDVLETNDKGLFEVANNDLVINEGNYRLNNTNAFVKLGELDANSNSDTYYGFINNAIRTNILADTKVKVGDSMYFKGFGELESLSSFNSQLVRQSAIESFGTQSVKVYPDGTLTLSNINKNEVELTSTQGNVKINKVKLKADLNAGKYSELAKKYDGFLDTVYTLFKEDNNLYDEVKVKAVSETKEEDLRISLLNTLNQLGVKVTTISNYLENYETRNGVDPSVEALADIANNVVAFAEGKQTVENLSEETAHFIIEGYQDQSKIDEILPLVEETPQWKQSSNIYYSKYSEQYQGAELDNIVRREILGKVLRDKIIDRFNTEEVSDTNVSLFTTLNDLWNSFLNMIRSYFTSTVRSEMNTVLNEIANKVVEEQISDYISPEVLSRSTFTMYSLTDKMSILTLQKARQQMEKQLNTLKKAKDVNSVKIQQELKRLTEALNNNEEWNAVKTVVSSVEAQTKMLKSQLDNYSKLSTKDSKTAYFTPEEVNIFRGLSEDFLPVLEELRVIVEKDLTPTEGINVENTIKQIDNLIKDIGILKGEARLQIAKDNNSIVNRIIESYNLSEADRDKLEQLVKNDLEEVGWFQRNFGSLEHASNVYLNILGKIINQNNNKANRHLLKDINSFLKDVDNGKWDLNKFKNLLEKVGDKDSNYTKSPYRFAQFEADELQARVSAYNEVFGTNLDIESYQKAKVDGKLKKKSDYTEEELSKFNSLMNTWYEENTEKRYNKEFYDKREKMYKDLGVEESTREFLQNISIRRYQILSKYIKPNTKIDYYKIPFRDRQQLATLVQERKSAKSLIDAETGLTKTGSALKLAQDLQNLDSKYQENKLDFKVSDDFYSSLVEVETNLGSQEAFEWLKVNGGIVFNDTFWSSFKEGRVSLMDKLDTIKEGVREESLEEYDRIDMIQEDLSDLLNKKTEILKQYQVPNNPSEVDYDNMSSQVLNNIKEIETELQTKFRDLNSILSKFDEEEVTDPSLQVENTVNESYYKALKDSNKSELDFILEHTTDNDRRNIREFERRLTRINTGSDFIDLSTRKFFEKLTGNTEVDADFVKNMVNKHGVDYLTKEYAKTRLLPYFKRFAPSGYDSLLNELKTGNRSVVELVKEISNKEKGISRRDGSITDYLNISTQFSWTEDEVGNNMLNPNYDENFEGGFRQPKVSKYLNQDFFNEYGIDKDNYLRTKQMKSTRNVEEFSMLNSLWDIKRKGLDAYNESGSQNIYKIPQVSKGVVERTKDFISKSPAKTIGNTIKDIIYNRVDDLGYGERIEGEDVRDVSDMRLIPKYYLRDLEESSDVSNELAHSYSMFLQSAYTYRERLNSVSDVMVLQEKMLNSKFKGGYDAKSTKSYEMFKNFTDAYFFGIKRSRKFEVALPNGKKIDISKMAIAFDKLVRMTNIGFSLPIAATSLLSAEVFLRIENYIGEYTNMHSAKWANKEFTKLAPKYITEIGNINKESRLNMLAERFRVYDLTDRTTSSGFNRIVRSGNHLPYKFSEIANFPIAPRIMLTVLDDFRLVGDKFVDFNTFKKSSEAQGLSKKDLLNKWNTHQENSMYNLLEENNGIIDFNQELKDRLGEEFLEEQLSNVQGRISRVNANVDSIVPQEDKSAATRDFLMNFMTAHRGWLSIAIQRKFKKSHFNFTTGQFEEGHYISLFRYLQDSYKLMEEKNLKSFIKAFKDNWHSLSDVEQRNLKRVMTEFGVYMMLLGLGTVVAALADDDDNKDLWALQFSAYIYFRTVSEVGSVQAPTGVFGLVDVVQAPFIAINSIKEIMDVKGWSLEEVNSGAYEGHSKLYRKLAKQTWIRHWYDLQGIKQKSDYYRLLNSETLFHLAK